MSKEYPSYNVYKGLQKPLIFKGFKGKFIYIGGACIISALLLCAIVSTLASFMWGGITLVIVMFGGLGITSQLQRKEFRPFYFSCNNKISRNISIYSSFKMFKITI